MVERKVVYATDLRGDVRGGLRLAGRCAADRAATLVILHVVPLIPSDGEGMLHTALDLRERPEAKVRRLIPDDPTVPYLHAVEIGDPKTRIEDVVLRERAELLIMESRARSTIPRMFRRTLTEQLIDSVPCPVLTYRADSVPDPSSRVPLAHVPSRLSSDALNAVLDARTGALRSWLRFQRETAERVAAERSVQDGVAALHRSVRYDLGRSFRTRIQALLELTLREQQRGVGAIGVEVRVAGSALVQLGSGAYCDRSYRRFLEGLWKNGSAVSLPLDPSPDRPYPDCVICAGAAVVLPGDDTAALIFTFDARRDFLRILAQPGPTPSAETYAFDGDGLMLSNSRFPDQLRRIGLLPPEAGSQTPRRLHLCDPGGNLLIEDTGQHSRRPLTRMAAAATSGEDGHDWSGYRDYRGVEVIGAWRWLPDLSFGVAAEMDRTNA